MCTRLGFAAPPDAVWNCLMLYEEVPGRAPLLLRLLLPEPERTEGKAELGELIRCRYRQGELVKRVTVVDAPTRLEFEVEEQALGLECCAMARGGAYELQPAGGGTEVALTTRYRAWLRPRIFWRRVEAGLGHRLHRHILAGIAGALADGRARASAAGTGECSSSRLPIRHSS